MCSLCVEVCVPLNYYMNVVSTAVRVYTNILFGRIFRPRCCLPGLAQGKESNSSMLRFQTCVDSNLKRHYPDCTVFQINFFYAEATSPGLCFYLSVPALGARWQFTQWCALTGIFLFMAYLPTAGNLHGPWTQGWLSACVPQPRFSNPDPALRQTSPWEHGMIYSAQFSCSTEICELVKQRSSMVNRKEHKSLFNP